MLDLVLVIRYRKSVTYGHNVLLAALEEHATDVRFDVRFATTAQEAVTAVQEARREAAAVAVLWSFYSPDAVALAEELRGIREQAPGALHIAGGVHATAEPEQVLNAGWDVAAVGEGESTVLGLVEALGTGGDLGGVPGIVFRNGDRTRRTGRAVTHPLDRFRAFTLRWRKYNPIEITRGCVYACRFCQTPFMFSARFRHRSVENVRWHVRKMREAGLRDVRFITPTSLSYGTEGKDPDLAAVEELLAACKEEIGPRGRVFFGSFPSEIRPEHMSIEALRLVRRYCANDNLIIGAQSGSSRILEAAKRGHGVEEVREAVRMGVSEGFRINVDMIFGMPGETREEAVASVALARELSDLGARIHAHTFMPLPGTPWREAPAGRIEPDVAQSLSQLSRHGALYGQWQKQQERSEQMAEAAREHPRPGRSRTLLPLLSAPSGLSGLTGRDAESGQQGGDCGSGTCGEDGVGSAPRR